MTTYLTITKSSPRGAHNRGYNFGHDSHETNIANIRSMHERNGNIVVEILPTFDVVLRSHR